ncbi:MAG: hypothetical protein ACJ8BW_18110, partial [Ktedonobacteraceae bacterium]
MRQRRLHIPEEGAPSRDKQIAPLLGQDRGLSVPHEVLKDLLESDKYLTMILLARPRRSKDHLGPPYPLVVARSANHLMHDLLQDLHEDQALLRPGDKQGVKKTDL